MAQNNFLILKKEYEDLEGTISKMYNDYEKESMFVITEADLIKGTETLASLERASVKDIAYKGQEMSFITSQRHQFVSNNKRQLEPYTTRYSENKAPHRDIFSKGHSTISTILNSERQEAITRFVKEKKEVNIKDILNVPSIVKGSSEKTIQRELLRLVALGVLKKQGERRWSRYSLTK